jgi:photosystem II stability/assembly factor-like uncharacterized protein
MKKMIFILLIIFNINAFAGQWRMVDSNFCQDCIGIDCSDSNNCIAVANYSLIFPYIGVTHDGGKTWKITYQNSSTQDNKSICMTFPDTNISIVLRNYGPYLRSTDKGETWEEIIIPLQTKAYKVKFNKELIGAVFDKNELFVSQDTGKTWNKLDIKLADLPDSLYPLYIHDISMPEKNTIILLVALKNYNTSVQIIRSFDLGKSWELMNPIPDLPGPISFIDKNTGWIGGGLQINPSVYQYSDRVRKTTDGGNTWVTQLNSLYKPVQGLNKIQFIDKNYGIATGQQAKLYKTFDGGNSWSMDTSLADWKVSQDDFNNCAYPAKDVIYACTNMYKQIWKYDNSITTNVIEPFISQKHFVITPNPVFANNEIHIRT